MWKFLQYDKNFISHGLRQNSRLCLHNVRNSLKLFTKSGNPQQDPKFLETKDDLLFNGLPKFNP